MAIVLGTDSESWIARINKEPARKVTHPKATLMSDWDITNKRQHHLRHYPFRITFEHVWGHQEIDTPYDDLPLLAQLNVDADALASTCMQDHSCTTTRFP
jgi:hypothetical protein